MKCLNQQDFQQMKNTTREHKKAYVAIKTTAMCFMERTE